MGVIGRLNKRVKAFDKRVEDKSDEITQRVLDSWAFAFLGPMCRICFYLVAIWIGVDSNSECLESDHSKSYRG